MVPDAKSQNKIYYYTISKSEDIINLTFTENDITEIIKGSNKGHLIIIESKENSILLDNETEMISGKLKGKFFDEAIVSYKNKCRQYIK